MDAAPPFPIWRCSQRHFAFHSLHFEDILRSSVTTVKRIFSNHNEVSYLHPLPLWHHHTTQKAQRKIKVLFFIKKKKKNARPAGRGTEGDGWDSTCCRCPPVLTARIREGGEYLLEPHRALDILYACRTVPRKDLQASKSVIVNSS